MSIWRRIDMKSKCLCHFDILLYGSFGIEKTECHLEQHFDVTNYYTKNVLANSVYLLFPCIIDTREAQTLHKSSLSYEEHEAVQLQTSGKGKGKLLDIRVA